MTPLQNSAQRRIFITLFLGLCWIVMTRVQGQQLPPHTSTGIVPQMQLQRLDGSLVGTQSLIGSPAIVTVWASWCPACRAAMPFWERRAADLAAKDVQLIALNQRESVETVQVARRAFPPNLTVWADPNGTFLQFLQSTDLPTTAFIDRHGRVVSVVRGPVSAAVVTVLVDQLTGP